MSTFEGVINEYPLISIDCFLPDKNYTSTLYFLSHCHTDHMKGLNERSFHKLLISRGFSRIYLSDVSNHLLKNDLEYKHLSDYLVGLPIEQPTIIILYDEYGKIHSRVVVTLLTAAHCPGSVMFLIEGKNGHILYTGDFRLPVGSSARLTHMHDDNGCLKPLQSLYIDTTFCNEKCLFIPSREECLDAIVSLVEPWIYKGPNYIVCFFCPSQYAYEFVFVELYKRFGVKTHVTEERQKKYIGIKHIEDVVTSISTEARIHACAYEKSDMFSNEFYKCQTPCGYFAPNKMPVRVMKIKPSAMFFQSKAHAYISQYDYKLKMHRVCYSTHPSLSEVRDMVNYLKPKNVYPNVVKHQTEEEILALIFKSLPLSSSSESEQENSISPLGKLKRPLVKNIFSDGNNSLPFYDECYHIGKDQKNLAHSSKKNSDCAVNEIFSVETDYENTEEQEVMLKEELYSYQKNVAKNCNGDDDLRKSFKDSPLKWINPIVSSEEVSDHNSSLGNSLNGKSNSDSIYGISGENYSSEELSDKEIVESQKCVVEIDGHTISKALVTNDFVSHTDKSISVNKQLLIESNISNKSSSSLLSGSYNNLNIYEKLKKTGSFENIYKNQTISNISVLNGESTKHNNKPFHFIKKINNTTHSNENEDNSFKHIIKLNKKVNNYVDSNNGNVSFRSFSKLSRKDNVDKNCSVSKNSIISNYSNGSFSGNDQNQYLSSEFKSNLKSNSVAKFVKANDILKTDFESEKTVKNCDGSNKKFQPELSNSKQLLCDKIYENNCSRLNNIKSKTNCASDYDQIESSSEIYCKGLIDNENCKLNNVVKNIESTVGKSKLPSHRSVSDSKLQFPSKHKTFCLEDYTSEFKQNNSYRQNTYSTEFNNSSPSSKNSGFKPHFKKQNYFSSNKNNAELSENIQKSNFEILNIFSDSSSEEICVLDSLNYATNKIYKHENSQNVESGPSKVCSSRAEKIGQTAVMNLDCSAIGSNTSLIPNGQRFMAENQNFLEDRIDAGASNEVMKNSNILHANQNVKEIEIIGETLAVSQPSCSNFTKESNSFGDLDDSPSLIAPTLHMTKNTSVEIFSCGGDVISPKRRKIESNMHFILDTNKSCDFTNNYMHHNQDIKDIDSTPEDLIENCNMVGADVDPQRHSPEIIIIE